MKHKPKIKITNSKAYYDYHIEDPVNAGLVLTSNDVKAIRSGTVRLQGNHVAISIGGADVVGVSGFEAPRRLLLTSKELNDLIKWTSIKGNTALVTEIFENDRGLFKAVVAHAKGKKLHDKRASLKEKDIKREINE